MKTNVNEVEINGICYIPKGTARGCDGMEYVIGSLHLNVSYNVCTELVITNKTREPSISKGSRND